MLPLSTKSKILGFRRAVAAAAVSLLFAATAQGQQSGPFAKLVGAWSGAGTLQLSGGANERIRCRATYNVDASGASLRLDLRCASDSYKFDLRGNIFYSGGEVKGDWNETTRRVAGSVMGSVKGNQFSLRVDSKSFAALLSLTTDGKRQSISIQTPAGSEMAGAEIKLSRQG
jgi:hypothetical protein